MTERQMQLEDWLDDLCVRFIINLPEDNLSSVERICFQVEEAQWYYEDFIRPLDPNLPSLSLRNFCLRIFTHCPLLAGFAVDGKHMQAFDEFLMYKKRIPVRGAIMLNEAMDSAVLVKGWKKGANWSFPRGKINKDEDDLICAIREVYEETGFDLEKAGLVPDDGQVKHIEINMRDQQMKLYVFKNVPMDTYFEPRTRKEISKIQWWHLSELPAFKKKNQHDQQSEVVSNANKFYMVAPFLVPLRKWVLEQKKKDANRRISNQYLSAGDEFMTEEDRGNESTTQAPYYVSPMDSNSVEEANEKLASLLKTSQPSTQGLQVETAKNNTGDALLALLRSGPSNLDAQTPQGQVISQPQLPHPPHHQHPRPPKFSEMPPPPNFPIQPPNDSYLYQQPNLQHHQLPDARYSQAQFSRTHENPHLHEPQHLVHPQPLPPNVQRAVFTGVPVHSTPLSQAIPPHVPQPGPSMAGAFSNQQFPVNHAPMISQAANPAPPTLTRHSLALLNAFKKPDQSAREAVHPNDLPLRLYPQEQLQAQIPRAQPQELPAELAQPTPTGPPSMRIPAVTSNVGQAFVSRQPISASHKSALLDIFKSPTTQMAVPAKAPAATALPTSKTPSAVELSAVEPLSSTAASTSALLNDKRAPDTLVKGEVVTKMNPEANLPFRAMKILARPAQKPKIEELPGPSVHTKPAKANGKRSGIAVTKTRAEQVPSSFSLLSEGFSSGPPSPGKVFQPQILKRSQSGFSNKVETSSAVSPKPSPLVPHSRLDRPAPSLPVLTPDRHTPVLPIHSVLERETVTPVATTHKATLLSLFGKPSTATANTAPFSSNKGNPSPSPADISSRTRVGSIASGDAASRRGSQTPLSPADKGFLFSYLDAFANGSQR